MSTSIASLTLGSVAMPVTYNWFTMPTQGPWIGKTVFTIEANLSAVSDDALYIHVVKPDAGQFLTSTAINFDPSPTALMVADSYILEDRNPQTMLYTRILYANTGSITFTDIGENSDDLINGTVAVTNYREIDEISGADVDGGCTTVLGGLTFYLKQM